MHSPSTTELGRRSVEIGLFESQPNQGTFQFRMIIVATHHLEMFRQIGYPVNQFLISLRFVVCPIGQLLIESVNFIRHFVDMFKSQFSLLANGPFVLQLHVLRQIANGRLFGNTDCTSCGRL